jgi:hypothetical protein
LDHLGYHVAVCKSGPFNPVTKHNAIRNLLFSLCQRAAWNPKLEYPCLDSTKEIPADIYLPNGPTSQPTAVDVTIIHPHSERTIEKASSSIDFSNHYAEKRKNDKYLDKCIQNNIKFLPLSVEYFGRLSPNTLSFITRLSTSISNRFGGSKNFLLKDIQRKFFVCMIRNSSKAMITRTPSRLAY